MSSLQQRKDDDGDDGGEEGIKRERERERERIGNSQFNYYIRRGLSLPTSWKEK